MGEDPEYKSAQHIGTLVNTPAVSMATCPTGSVSNTTNQPGVTTDGKCKQIVCQPITGTPLPANGTAIGTCGFTWGNAIYQWIAPIISVVTPAQCKF